MRWLLLLCLAAGPACGSDPALPLPDPSTVTTLDLGPVAVPASGLSDPVGFDVPAGALSLLVHARAPAGAPGRLSLEVTQDGVLRCSHLDPLGSESPMLPATGEATIALPSGSAGLARELGGHYQVRIFDDAGGLGAPAHLWASFKTAPGPLARQRLPLTLVLVGAVARAPIEAALDETRRLYAAAGVDLEVAPEAITISGAEAAPFASVDVSSGPDSPGLIALLALSARVPAGQVALFVVPRLTEADLPGGLSLYGSAGDIPIPVLLGGAHGGVAVAQDTAQADAHSAGIAIAHELGHALGLFHTSESSGQRHDSLSSTPECPAARDANGDGVVNPDECVGAGADNLMFWALGTGSPTLTDEQSALLRRSPHTVGQ